MNSKLVTPQQKLADGNPFYKMTATLSMLQQVSKMTDNPSESAIVSLLNNAWKECNSDVEKKKLFFSILFSFGDINNREHNIFRKKGIKNVDQGGVSLRKAFLYILKWMHTNVPEQFYKFLPIFGEYYNLGANTMYFILWTDRFKGKVTEQYKVAVDIDILTDYIAKVLTNPRTPENELKLWAKWLWHIPSSTRTRKFTVTDKGLKSVKVKYGADYKVGDIVRRTGVKLAETKVKDKWTLSCIELLSKKMSWTIIQHPKNVEYAGYREFRKKWLADTEATLFSTQKIKQFDSDQLFNWFEQLPSGARYNVQRRLLDQDKITKKLTSNGKWITNNGTDIGKTYLVWLSLKEKAQQELRNVSPEEKVKLAKEQPDVLKAMEKAAKVNTGGTTLLDSIVDLFRGGNQQQLDLVAHSIMEKVKVDVPVLTCVDTSGSMSSTSLVHKGVSLSAIQMARLATTVFLLKNPKPELQDMFINYNSTSRVITTGASAAKAGVNRFMGTGSQTVGWLTDQKKSFIDNFNNISSILRAGGGTAFHSISQSLKTWVDEEPAYRTQRIEQILQYPVFLNISDGDFNGTGIHSGGVAASSLVRFQQEMRQWFGWEGVVVIWDVQRETTTSATKFDNVPNVIYYGGCNPGILNQIFCNISDLDVIDQYTPLLSLSKSNRYSPVRELVM